ncbi:MAG: DNA/RNA non-specific endonuclease [Lachnospiraceae bacterium]|nr:DNA/RNA non-specific endonuclease [Lachnospiraceae bacterium]
MKKIVVSILSVMLLVLFGGCGLYTDNKNALDSLSYTLDSDEELIPDKKGAGNTDEVISLSNIPEYFSEPYVELNGNVPEFTDDERKIAEPFETYSNLDALGRCGVAYVNVCRELMPNEERGNIGSVKPSGWHTVKYNDLIEGNYLYNRCHLIAYQLAGENANEKNLITGTRYLNIAGMLPFENMINDYVDSTGNHVLYRVTPIFKDNNLVASGVEMEGLSVEDNGEGICFHVYCYNVQPGVGIDYATGESWEDVAVSGNTDSGITPDEMPAMDFIINTNTRKIHLPECSGADEVVEKNKELYTGTIKELIEQGYSPCKRCLREYGQ